MGIYRPCRGWKAAIECSCRTEMICYCFQQWRACPLSSSEIVTPQMLSVKAVNDRCGSGKGQRVRESHQGKDKERNKVSGWECACVCGIGVQWETMTQISAHVWQPGSFQHSGPAHPPASIHSDNDVSAMTKTTWYLEALVTHVYPKDVLLWDCTALWTHLAWKRLHCVSLWWMDVFKSVSCSSFIMCLPVSIQFFAHATWKGYKSDTFWSGTIKCFGHFIELICWECYPNSCFFRHLADAKLH